MQRPAKNQSPRTRWLLDKRTRQGSLKPGAWNPELHLQNYLLALLPEFSKDSVFICNSKLRNSTINKINQVTVKKEIQQYLICIHLIQYYNVINVGCFSISLVISLLTLKYIYFYFYSKKGAEPLHNKEMWGIQVRMSDMGEAKTNQ